MQVSLPVIPRIGVGGTAPPVCCRPPIFTPGGGKGWTWPSSGQAILPPLTRRAP